MPGWRSGSRRRTWRCASVRGLPSAERTSACPPKIRGAAPADRWSAERDRTLRRSVRGGSRGRLFRADKRSEAVERSRRAERLTPAPVDVVAPTLHVDPLAAAARALADNVALDDALR